HPPRLDAHAGQADEVGASEAVEIDVIDILVYQRHAVMVGHERGEQGEARHGQVRALTEQTDAMLHAPEGGVEARIDDDDIGHGRTPPETPSAAVTAKPPAGLPFWPAT